MLSAARALVAQTPLLVVAVAIALTLSQIGDAGAQTDGRLAVDCEGNTRQIETTCQFGSGQEFTVSVHVTETPGGEYAGAQIKFRWDPAVLDYLPTDRPADEAAWQDCTLPLRFDNRPDDPSVLFGCIEFTGTTEEPIRLTTYTGPLVVFHMQCVNDGATELVLVPPAGDGQYGSHLLSPIGVMLSTTLDGAAVTCGGPQAVRPAPEVTVGVEPITEDEDGGSGAPTEGGPTPSEDAATSTPGDDRDGAAASGDDAEGGIPLWAWILIGLGGGAALGTVGAFAWLRLRSRA